ncbi:MAG: hypothetical protein JO287_13990 [Pseudonocardiales bacterium]|nr:hypothetical protein [Pseudonocardiales bacterium]
MHSFDIEAIYRELRPYSFAIAYRMLGSVSEAEDVVQEAFVRLSRTMADEIDNPKAYLATITTRLAIDALRSARSQRETYFGPWLPEPLVHEYAADAADVADTAGVVDHGVSRHARKAFTSRTGRVFDA